MYKNQDELYRNSFQMLKCLKCGSYHNIQPFEIAIFYNKLKTRLIKRNSKYIIDSLAIPVCLRCNLEFQRWKRFQDNHKRQIFINLLYFLVSNFLVWTIWQDFIVQICFSIIFVTISFIYSINSLFELKQMEYKPSRFFYFKKEGTFCVKEEASTYWIPYLDWVKETIYERVYINECRGLASVKRVDVEYISCIYCGAKIRIDDVRCFKCDKLLPLI